MREFRELVARGGDGEAGGAREATRSASKGLTVFRPLRRLLSVALGGSYGAVSNRGTTGAAAAVEARELKSVRLDELPVVLAEGLVFVGFELPALFSAGGKGTRDEVGLLLGNAAIRFAGPPLLVPIVGSVTGWLAPAVLAGTGL